jgi:putative Holliday junction resolvase
MKKGDRTWQAAALQGLQKQTQIPVILWDESFSTQDARATRIELGVSRKKRAGHMDELAAVIILRSYLDANRPGPE